MQIKRLALCGAPCFEWFGRVLAGVRHCFHLPSATLGHFLPRSPRPCQHFQLPQIAQRKFSAIVVRAAHVPRGLQLPAHRRAVGLAKDFATPLRVQLHARHARRFAPRHARNGRGDGRRNAARGAARAASCHERRGRIHRGHSAHSCKGCFMRPASSPAAGPDPA